MATRSAVAATLHDFYRLESDPAVHAYTISLPDTVIRLSIVTQTQWINTRVPLITGAEQVVHRITAPGRDPSLHRSVADAAVARLAEICRTHVRATDAHLYALTDIQLTADTVVASFDTATFAEYALTADLLEAETVAATAKRETTRAALPVRESLLPDLQSVLEPRSRLCAGGTVALFAAARSADHRRSEPDYALLVQRRSAGVLNATGRLATIPKAFHQPLNDLSGDVHLSATLMRELDEELFGRPEVDLSTPGPHRDADPMHPTRLSAPLRWLMDRPRADTWRIECLGFGYNLLSGNYEFACAIIVHDPHWWDLFGGIVTANWEADQLLVYSSSDQEALVMLMTDPRWSDEGLFAFHLGLTRLRQLPPPSSKE